MASRIFANMIRTHKRLLKFGVPMVTLVVVGSFGLKEFTDIKIKRRDSKVQKLTSEEALNVLPKRETKMTLEDAYSEISTKVDINTWENKRGPRPWEETQNK